MRRITFWLSLILIFIIPWEDSVTIGAVGSAAKMTGFVIAVFWLLTILWQGGFRKPHLFHLAVLVFFWWNILSLLWTSDMDGTILRTTTYAQIFLLLLVFWELYREPEDMRAGLQAYVLGGFVCIASTVINYLNGRMISTSELRYSATGVNAVDLALLLILGLPLAWHLITLASDKKKSIWFWINLAYMPLAVFAVILTGSRTALFAILPVIVFILMSRRITFTKKFLIFMVLAVSMIALYVYVPQAVLDRFATTADSIRTADLSRRVNLWRETIAVFDDHPFIGSGSGSLTSIIGNAAHNTFLSVAAETGIIGLALLLFILAIVFWQAINLPKPYAAFWLTVLAVWAIGNLSLTWEYRKPTWLFLSFVIIEGSLLHSEVRSQKADRKVMPVTPRSTETALP